MSINSALTRRYALAVVPFVFIAASMCANADTYILGGSANESNVGSSSSPIAWGTATNWEPEGVPGSADTVNWAPTKTGSHRHAYVLLDGDYTVGSLATSYRSLHLYKDDSSETVSLTFSTQFGGDGYQKHEIYDGATLVMAAGSVFRCSRGDHDWTGLTIYSGGEADIYGAIESRVMKLNVSGGRLVFSPTSYGQASWGRDANDHDEINVSSGAAVFPNGISMTSSYTVAHQFGQQDGTVTFGGSFSSATPWTYTWSGGTLEIVGDCAFAANISLTVPASAAVTLDVAAGKTFSAPGLVADATATITKTGAGTFSFAPTAASIVLNGGALGLASASAYDLSNVSLGAGASASIALTAMGARVDSLPAALAGATFAADLSGVAQGTVVFYSADPDVLAKVQADLASSVPQGFQLAVSGEALSLEAVSDYVFNAAGDLLSDQGWSTGSVPPAGTEVAIDGVVANFTGGAIPAWESIEVKNGAILRIAANADLPHIILNKDATLEIAAGTSFLTNGFSCTPAVVGENVSLPILEIATNATVSVASDMKFKNVDFRLYGTVTKASDDDSPVFGYADAGETSYIAFTADGGVFDFHSNQNAGKGSVSIICPASGGTVVPVGAITLRNSSRQVKSWADFGNWEFGVNNPTTVPFDVIVDGTALDCSAYFYASGAAHMSLVNGSYIRRNTSCLGHYFSQAIQYSGTVAVGEGCYLDFTTGDGSFGIDSQSAVDTVTVRDGGAYTVSYNSSGWGVGVFVSDGGVLGVGKIYNQRERTDLLRGFGSARLDGDLAIASVNIGTGNTDWDRHVKMADVPFSGTGDVTVTNGVPAYPFTVTMVNGANTATGSIKVAKADGDSETALYFANGANWAGTVVAGNVSLTNLTDGATTASVTFGSISLPSDTAFPVRAWSDGAGGFENDTVDAGQYDNGGGRLTPICMTSGVTFAPGDTIVVGKMAKTSPLPRAARGWFAEVKPIEGDDDNVQLVLVRGKGLQVIVM